MKRKTGLRQIRILTGMLLTAFLYWSAVTGSALVNKRADVVTIQLDGQKLDAASAQELCQQELSAEEPLELNCWGETGKTVVESRENGQSASVSLLYTGEKSGLIVPGTEILSWKEDGCFFDKKTAADLFGSEKAAGQIIWCGDRKYTVCGTFESFRNLMLCRVHKEDGAVLTAISCRVPELSGAASCVQEFMMRRNLAGEILDFTFLAYLSHDLLLLLPLCLGIRLLQMISSAAASQDTQGWFPSEKNSFSLLDAFGQDRRRWSHREESSVPLSDTAVRKSNSPEKEKILFRTFLRCLQLILVVGIFVFLWANIRIPSDMIPSRWSDFSFWGTWWETRKENLLLLLRTAQGEAQTMLLWSFCRSVCADAGAAICLLLNLY